MSTTLQQQGRQNSLIDVFGFFYKNATSGWGLKSLLAGPEKKQHASHDKQRA